MKNTIENYAKGAFAVIAAGGGVVIMCLGFAIIKVSILNDFLKMTED